MILPERYVDVKFFISVGSSDMPVRISAARGFCAEARNKLISARCEDYPAGHLLVAEQIEHSLEFFKEILTAP